MPVQTRRQKLLSPTTSASSDGASSSSTTTITNTTTTTTTSNESLTNEAASSSIATTAISNILKTPVKQRTKRRKTETKKTNQSTSVNEDLTANATQEEEEKVIKTPVKSRLKSSRRRKVEEKDSKEKKEEEKEILKTSNEKDESSSSSLENKPKIEQENSEENSSSSSLENNKPNNIEENGQDQIESTRLISLQSIIRMHLMRRNVEKSKHLIITVQSLVRSYLNKKQLLTIHSFINGILIRNKCNHEKDLIVKLQGLLKSSLQEKNQLVVLQSIIRQFNSYHHLSDQIGNVISLQNLCKNHLERKCLKLEKSKILMIQSKCRNKIEMITMEQSKNDIVNLQSLIRGHLIRNEFNSILNVTENIQALYRNQIALSDSKQLSGNITTLQSLFNGYNTRLSFFINVENEKHQKSILVSNLENLIQAYSDRKHLMDLKESVLSIQSLLIGQVEQMRLKNNMDSLLFLQCTIRKYLSERNFKQSLKDVIETSHHVTVSTIITETPPVVDIVQSELSPSSNVESTTVIEEVVETDANNSSTMITHKEIVQVKEEEIILENQDQQSNTTTPLLPQTPSQYSTVVINFDNIEKEEVNPLKRTREEYESSPSSIVEENGALPQTEEQDHVVIEKEESAESSLSESSSSSSSEESTTAVGEEEEEEESMLVSSEEIVQAQTFIEQISSITEEGKPSETESHSTTESAQETEENILNALDEISTGEAEPSEVDEAEPSAIATELESSSTITNEKESVSVIGESTTTNIADISSISNIANNTYFESNNNLNNTSEEVIVMLSDKDDDEEDLFDSSTCRVLDFEPLIKKQKLDTHKVLGHIDDKIIDEEIKNQIEILNQQDLAIEQVQNDWIQKTTDNTSGPLGGSSMNGFDISKMDLTGTPKNVVPFHKEGLFSMFSPSPLSKPTLKSTYQQDNSFILSPSISKLVSNRISMTSTSTVGEQVGPMSGEFAILSPKSRISKREQTPMKRSTLDSSFISPVPLLNSFSSISETSITPTRSDNTSNQSSLLFNTPTTRTNTLQNQISQLGKRKFDDFEFPAEVSSPTYNSKLKLLKTNNSNTNSLTWADSKHLIADDFNQRSSPSTRTQGNSTLKSILKQANTSGSAPIPEIIKFNPLPALRSSNSTPQIPKQRTIQFIKD